MRSLCSVDLLPRYRPQTHRTWPVLRDTQSPALTPSSTDFFPCSLVPWGSPSFQYGMKNLCKLYKLLLTNKRFI